MLVTESSATIQSRKNLEEITKGFQKLYDYNCKKSGRNLTSTMKVCNKCGVEKGVGVSPNKEIS